MERYGRPGEMGTEPGGNRRTATEAEPPFINTLDFCKHKKQGAEAPCFYEIMFQIEKHFLQPNHHYSEYSVL